YESLDRPTGGATTRTVARKAIRCRDPRSSSCGTIPTVHRRGFSPASAQGMPGDSSLYRRYPSTAALPDGTDARALLAWSRTYFAAHVAPLLPPDRGAVIAEVGCGWGRYLVALAEAGYARCEGIDVSEEQVAY